MNSKARTLVIALALAAAGTALNSQAQYQDAAPATSGTKTVTQHQQQELDWLAAEINLGSTTFQPVPFPVPARTPARPLRPATAHTAAEDAWLTQEMNLGSTTFAPVPFPVPSTAAQPVTTSQSASNRFWQAERRNDDGYRSDPTASN